MSMDKYWSGSWVLRCYRWKGEPFIAVYRGRLRMGVLRGKVEVAHELASAMGGKVVDLGEVRETKTITVHEVKAYEPIEHIGNGWGDYSGPTTKAEIEAADANDPGWDG